METKSRYEVLQELEQRKRALLEQLHGFDDAVAAKEKEIKLALRDVDDNKEELEAFKKRIPEAKLSIEVLIKSVDESLKMLTQSHGK